MNAEYKRLTVQMSYDLRSKMLDMLMKAFNHREENTSDIINLVISSHLSSMFNCMMIVSDEHEKIQERVEKFIHNLKEFIANQDVIKQIEVLR